MCTPADRARHTDALTEMGRLLDTVGAALLEHHTLFAEHGARLAADPDEATPMGGGAGLLQAAGRVH